MLDWNLYSNRRKIGCLSGMVPSEWSTGDGQRLGSITKVGVPAIRRIITGSFQIRLKTLPFDRVCLDFASGPVHGSQLLLFVVGDLICDMRRTRSRGVAVADQGLGHGSLRRELHHLNICVAIDRELRVRSR